MKPNKRHIASALIFSLLVIFSLSCKKSKLFKDTEAPEITLLGPDTVDLPKGSAAADFGATATDKRSGDCSATIKSNWDSIVQLNKIGLFQVTYTANDKNNNIAFKNRIIRIFYNNPLPEGEFKCFRDFSVYYVHDTATCVFKISRDAAPDSYQATMTSPRLGTIGDNNSPRQFTFVALKNDNTSFYAEGGGFSGTGKFDAATKKLTIELRRSQFVALNRTDEYQAIYTMSLQQ